MGIFFKSRFPIVLYIFFLCLLTFIRDCCKGIGIPETQSCISSILAKIESPSAVSLVYVESENRKFLSHPNLFDAYAISSVKTNLTNHHFWSKNEDNSFQQIFLISETMAGIQNADYHKGSIWIWIYTNENPETTTLKIEEEFLDLSQVYFCRQGQLEKIWCIKSRCGSEQVGNQIKFQTPHNFNSAKISFGTPTLTKFASSKTPLYLEKEKEDMFRILLNFSSKRVKPKNYGKGGGNSWESISKLVESKAVDLVVSPSILLPYRTQQFRFLVISQMEILRAYYQPETDATIHDITIVGFHIRIWMMLLCQIVLIAFCLRVFLNFEPGEGLVGSLGIFSMQGLNTSGHGYKAQFLSARIFSFVVNVSALLFFCGFSGGLVANLSNNEDNIKSLEQLISRKYKFGFKNNDSYLYASHLVGESRNSTIGRIIQSRQFRHFYGTAQSREAVKKDKRLVLLSERNLYTTSTNLSGDFHDFVVEGEKVKLAGIVIRGSPLSDPFNYALLRVWEVGLRIRLDKYEEADEALNMPIKNVPPKARGIELDDIYVPFCIISFGFFLGLLLGLKEVIMWRMSFKGLKRKVKPRGSKK